MEKVKRMTLGEFCTEYNLAYMVREVVRKKQGIATIGFEAGIQGMATFGSCCGDRYHHTKYPLGGSEWLYTDGDTPEIALNNLCNFLSGETIYKKKGWFGYHKIEVPLLTNEIVGCLSCSHYQQCNNGVFWWIDNASVEIDITSCSEWKP